MLITIIGTAACEKQINNPEVETYINQLKSGQLEFGELPAFTSSDIPALLMFRNDTISITGFPKTRFPLTG
jgi:hypothetical protein